jgi:glucosamine--fructose-6-phosphate aminotransferase (isomerizing)
MPNESFSTYREIISQPEAWQEALEIMEAAPLIDTAKYERIIFTGCGSTYYLSVAAAALYQELTGCMATAIPGGELLLNSQVILTDQKILLVAISRSGATTETVQAVEKFKQDQRGQVVVISNNDEALSRSADVKIIIPKGQEQSFAQTRSFASMYVAAVVFCVRAAQRVDLLRAMTALPGLGQRLIRDCEPSAREIGECLSYDRFYFLGSGIRYGLACEVNLKMKEMALTHSEPFHFLEFRHGPMSMVNQSAVVVGLLSESNASHEKAVLSEMQALGGKTVSLAESGADITLDSGIPENVRGVLYLPTLQLMAYYRSLAKGLNPDRPRHLVPVIKLNSW